MSRTYQILGIVGVIMIIIGTFFCMEIIQFLLGG